MRRAAEDGSIEVLLVGCGNMGHALAAGWLSGEAAVRLHVVEPVAALRERAAAIGAAAHATLDEVPEGVLPDVVLLAVKPQQMAGVLPACRRFVRPGACVLSVAAGISLATLQAGLGEEAALIRCMPNTPAAIGAGMLVCVANDRATAADRAAAEQLLSAGGRVRFLDDEALMDAVTAVSGSGPAYVFHVIDCLEKAGVAEGLPAELARDLALQTVYGAGRLARESVADPATLRVQVTSPNGTTAAALAELMGADGVDPVIARAVAAARRRSIELGRG